MMLLLLMLTGAPAALADDAAPQVLAEGRGLLDGVEPLGDPVHDAALVDERARAIGAGLRCPVCQGMSVADSTTAAAVNMQARIAELIQLGYSDAQVTDYFVSRYGTWVLLEPPATGNNLLIFVGPAAAVVLGGLAIGLMVARRRRMPDPEAVGLDPVTDDPYAQRILEELDQ